MRTIAHPSIGTQAPPARRHVRRAADYVITGPGPSEWRRAFAWWGRCARLDRPYLHISRRGRRANLNYDLYTTEDHLSQAAVDAIADAFDTVGGRLWCSSADAGHVHGISADDAEALAAKILDIIRRDREPTTAGSAIGRRLAS